MAQCSVAQYGVVSAGGGIRLIAASGFGLGISIGVVGVDGIGGHPWSFGDDDILLCQDGIGGCFVFYTVVFSTFCFGGMTSAGVSFFITSFSRQDNLSKYDNSTISTMHISIS